MAAAEELDNLPESERSPESPEAGEKAPENPEAAIGLIEDENRELLESAGRETDDLGPEGAEATEQLKRDIDAETAQTMDSIALAQEALRLQQSDPLNPETMQRAAEMFSQALELSSMEKAEANRQARERTAEVATEEPPEKESTNPIMAAAERFVAAQATGDEAAISDTYQDMERLIAEGQGEKPAEDRQASEFRSYIERLRQEAIKKNPELAHFQQDQQDFSEDRLKMQEEGEAEKQRVEAEIAEKERRLEAELAEKRAELEADQAARKAALKAEQSAERVRLEAQAPQREEMPVEMSEAEQSAREAEAAALMSQAEETSFDDFAPEGGGEWEALSGEGGTIEDQVRRQEAAKPQVPEMPVEMSAEEQASREAEAAAILDRAEMPVEMSEAEQSAREAEAAALMEAVEKPNAEQLRESAIEALDAVRALETEMRNEDVDIDRLDTILSDAETARESLDGYEDRPLEQYRQLLSDRIEALTASALALESRAAEERAGMASLEDEESASEQAGESISEGGLAEFTGLVTEIRMAEEHMAGLEKDIAAETDPAKKSELTAKRDRLQKHADELQDQRTWLLDSKGDRDRFMDRLMKYQDAKERLEKVLGDIERVGNVERDTKDSADLLDEIMLERDRSVDIEVDEFGDEVAGESVDIEVDEFGDEAGKEKPKPAEDKKTKPIPKKPSLGGDKLMGTGSVMPASREERKKRETLGDASKRYAKEAWKDLKDIFDSIRKGFSL